MESFNFDIYCPTPSGRCKSKSIGIFGILGSAIIIVGTIISACYYPSYNILGQFVSDLGRSTVYPQSVVFNNAMIFGNAVLILFNISVYAMVMDKKIGAVAVLTGVIASYGGILVGYCPCDVDPVGHVVGTTLSTVAIIPSMFCYTIAILTSKSGLVPKYMSMTTLIAFAFDIFYFGMALTSGFFDPTIFSTVFPAFNVPTILEWISVYCTFAFILMLSIYHLS